MTPLHKKILEKCDNHFDSHEDVKLLPIISSLLEANERLVEAISSSIARSDDYGDSHCSQPIRQALAANADLLERIAGGGDENN